jgi:phosphomannomutase
MTSRAFARIIEGETWTSARQRRVSITPVDVAAGLFVTRIVGGHQAVAPHEDRSGLAATAWPGASAPAIFRALGCEVIELFSEVDGNFPNHHPDPSKPENLRDLIKALKEWRCGTGPGL